MKNLLLSLTLIVSTSACSLFTSPDVTPALTANTKQKQIFDRQSSAFEAFLVNADMDPEVRNLGIANIAKDRSAFVVLNTAMAQFLAALGSLSPDDLDRVLDKALEIVDEVRDRQ